MTRRICADCRYWSDMAARMHGRWAMEALCLNQASPGFDRWIVGGMSCPAWASGHFGAVDGPPDLGDWATRQYARERT